VRLTLSTEESAAVDRLRAALGTTPFTVFGAAFAAVLARHTGSRSVCFGTPLASRRTSGSFDLCGFFVNTLPITLDVPWTKPFVEFTTAEVASELVDAMSHSEIPLSAVARHIGRGDSVFSVLLTAQEEVRPAAGAPVRAALLHGNGTAKFDLQVSVLRTGRTWALDFEHDRDTLPGPVVAALADSMRGALSRASVQPDLPLDRLFADAPQPGADEVVDISGHRAPVGVPGRLADGRRALWDERGSLVVLDASEEPAAPITSGAPAITGDDVEEDVRRLWSELLGCQVPVDESLVSYGAHSLNVLAAVELLEDRYGVAVPILDFFADPTVRTLAAVIRAARC
jgi:non-ribosomal peptide synthetase component F/acyl carrier protein